MPNSHHSRHSDWYRYKLDIRIFKAPKWFTCTANLGTIGLGPFTCLGLFQDHCYWLDYGPSLQSLWCHSISSARAFSRDTLVFLLSLEVWALPHHPRSFSWRRLLVTLRQLILKLYRIHSNDFITETNNNHVYGTCGPVGREQGHVQRHLLLPLASAHLGGHLPDSR